MWEYGNNEMGPVPAELVLSAECLVLRALVVS